MTRREKAIVRRDLEQAAAKQTEVTEELIRLCESFPSHFQSLYMESLLGQIRRAKLSTEIYLEELKNG